MILASTEKNEAQLELSYPAGWNAKGAVNLENSPSVSLSTKHMLAVYTNKPIPRQHAREIKALVHTKTQTQMFVAPLFKSAVNQKRANASGPMKESTAMRWGGGGCL